MTGLFGDPVKRMMESSGPRVIAYENRIDALEKRKPVPAEKALKTPPPKDSFEKMPELTLLFLANPHKFRTLGLSEVKGTVLKPAFFSPVYIRTK